MSEQRTFSKQQIAKIFRVNRATVYAWENQGCPVQPPLRPGQPARLLFERVLEWRLNMLDARGVSEAGLLLEEELARKRMAEIHG